jgi:MoaA/NifB/PqqE/SkfB family radical SAM enzyme
MIVVWRITERCNLACSFCAFDRSLQRSRRDADRTEVLRLGALFAERKRSTGERVLVSWLGGEPFLWRDLFTVTPVFTDEYGLAVSATTNGVALGRRSVRDFVLSHFAELTISVDGFAEQHERLRGWPGGFARLRAGVRALAEARSSRAAPLTLRANVVLMRDNRAEFPALCEELADWGFDEITFNELGGRDRPEFYPAHRLRPADVEALRAELPALRARLAACGVRVRGNEEYLRRLAASSADVAIPVPDCAPGEPFLFVDERCTLAPCSYTVDDFAVAGHELHDSAGLAEVPRLFAAAQRGRASSQCADCRSTHVFAKFAS